jgi:hypothetical protein
LVGLFVGWLVCWLVGPSVGSLVNWLVWFPTTFLVTVSCLYRFKACSQIAKSDY